MQHLKDKEHELTILEAEKQIKDFILGIREGRINCKVGAVRYVK